MAASRRATALLSLAAACCAYSKDDVIAVQASHVGPVANSAETYSWFALPFCKGSGDAAGVDLSDSFSGDRKVSTPYELQFGKNEDMKTLCTQKLSEEDVDKFSTAIEEEWYGEMFVDDLPMWIYVGESTEEDFLIGHTDRSKHYLYTHLHFVIGYNGDKIVSANVSASPIYRQDITTHDPSHSGVPNLGESHGSHAHGGAVAHGGAPFTPIEVAFTYSVQWVESDVPFDRRMELYTENVFMLQAMEIHWLSIVNSLVLVMLLTAFLAIILMRVVKNDFTRYMRADEDDEAAEEETGWKLIHGDVFRTPPHLSLLTAFVGAGLHLFIMTLFLLSLAVAGTFSLARRGSVVAACIILYVLTAFVGGYESARLYKQLKGTSWVWNVMLSLVVFPAPFTATFAVLNTTAIVKSSTAALPAGTIAVVVAMFLFIAFPLGVLGGIAGHNNKEFEPPCRTSKVPRQIPDVPWYRSSLAQMFMAGFLPFSSVSIELHYIFASVWGHKVYTLYGILLLAFVLLTIVTSFIVIALTYFQLAAEDHRWWWRSFLSGGMVGVFIYAYCVFYFLNHSGMRGFLQTSFYFLYMANVAFAFFLICGAIGFYSAFGFVRYVFSQVKTD